MTQRSSTQSGLGLREAELGEVAQQSIWENVPGRGLE